jgi:hypothetical protein
MCFVVSHEIEIRFSQPWIYGKFYQFKFIHCHTGVGAGSGACVGAATLSHWLESAHKGRDNVVLLHASHGWGHSARVAEHGLEEAARLITPSLPWDTRTITWITTMGLSVSRTPPSS